MKPDLMRVVVRRENGSVMAQAEESGEGIGRVRLRLYREGTPAEAGPPSYVQEMTTLEALELSGALRAAREGEVSRMRADLDCLKQGEMVFPATLDEVKNCTVDYETWMGRLRKRTMEWMVWMDSEQAGISRVLDGYGGVPGSVFDLDRSCMVMAMACCGHSFECRTVPDGLWSLNRCFEYLRFAPSARERMDAVATLSEPWRRLVARWDELERSFIAECGEGFSLSSVGPKTEGLLERILEGR